MTVRSTFHERGAPPFLPELPAVELPAERGARFVLWRHEDRDGKPTKIPLRANGLPADSTKASSWSTRERCEKALGVVRADGIGTVTGRVLGDETWFDSHRTAPGWKAQFYINESPPISALIVDRGLVGRYTSRNPALSAAQLFTKALARAGVHVTGAASLGAAGDEAVDLASIDSPTLESIVHFMDQASDNFTAEMLTKELGAVQLGQGTTAAGLRVVYGQLAQAGIPLAGVRMVDGSGLSLLDRQTPTALVSLLRTMWNDPELQPELVASLPLAGRTGTLHDRMRGTAAAGVVRAKTGTTDNSTALSGFVGDRYVFSVIVNGNPVSWLWSRVAEDRFAEALAAQ